MSDVTNTPTPQAPVADKAPLNQSERRQALRGPAEVRPNFKPTKIESKSEPKTESKSLANNVTRESGEEALPDIDGMTKAEARKEIAKHKVKIDGEIKEVDYEELLKGYSHQQAANKKMQEATKTQERSLRIIEQLKDEGTLFEAIRELGHDPRGLSERYLAEIIQHEMLDPKDRELKEAKQKIKEYEDQKRFQKEEQETRTHAEMEKRFSEDYTKQFISALEGTELPATKEVIGRMAYYIKLAADLKNYEMSAKEAMDLVRKEYQTTYRSVLASADGENLIRMLGDDVANKVRKYDTSRIKDPNRYMQTPEANTNRDNSERSGKRNRNETPTAKSWKAFNRS